MLISVQCLTYLSFYFSLCQRRDFLRLQLLTGFGKCYKVGFVRSCPHVKYRVCKDQHDHVLETPPK